MYISHQGLHALQEERVTRLLARAERQRMLKQARDAAARGQRRRRSWRALLGAFPYGRNKPSYEPSPSGEQ